MNLLIRFHLIALLALLQFAAPLLHAHKIHTENLGFFVHLPEFELVNSCVKHSPELVAPTSYEGNVIAVSMGMNNNSEKAFLIESVFEILLWTNLFLIICGDIQKRCRIAFQTEPIFKRLHLKSSSSPRAPPFFTFA